MNRYEKIAALCKQKGISIRRLESDLGFSNGYISKMKNSTPNADAVSKVAWYFQVPAESLENDESRNEEWIRRYYVEKPLYRASAGQGAYNDTYATETIEADDDGCDYAKVIGDSMYPDLHDGDVVKIQRQTETSPHDYTLVKVDGEHATIKFVEIVSDGVWLRAVNKSVFEDRFYSVAEVMTLPVTIIGRVTELRRSL